MGKKGIRERLLGKTNETAAASSSVDQCESTRTRGIRKRTVGTGHELSDGAGSGQFGTTNSIKKRTQGLSTS